MGHPDNGFIQAFLDGEVGDSEAEELRHHLDECEECRSRIAGLESAAKESAQALQLLDREPRLEDVRRRVFQLPEPRDENREADSPRRTAWWAASLPRAASIALLLMGAVATALPGSPVRRWVVQGWEAVTQSPTGPSQVEEGPIDSDDPVTPSQETGLPETGAGIPALGEGVEIWIHGLPTEAELRVLWTEGEEAWVYSAEGTRFNRADGRLEAFDPPGAVRVEIPRSFRHVIVGLDESILLRKSGEEVEILGPVQARTPSEIRFEAPGR